MYDTSNLLQKFHDLKPMWTTECVRFVRISIDGVTSPSKVWTPVLLWWICQPSSTFGLNFALNLRKHYGPCPVQPLVVPYPKESFRTAIQSDWELVAVTQTFFNYLLEPQFYKTFEDKWPERIQKCILSRGRCFEKDRSKNE